MFGGFLFKEWFRRKHINRNCIICVIETMRNEEKYVKSLFKSVLSHAIQAAVTHTFFQ